VAHIDLEILKYYVVNVTRSMLKNGNAHSNWGGQSERLRLHYLKNAHLLKMTKYKRKKVILNLHQSKGKDGLVTKVLKTPMFKDNQGVYIAICDLKYHTGLVMAPETCERRHCMHYHKHYLNSIDTGDECDG